MGCASVTASAGPNKESVNAFQGPSFFDKYTLGGKLGKGGFAQVRILENTGDAGPLAVKIMDLRQEEDGRLVPNPRFRKEAVEEAGAWRQAGHHEHIVGLRDAFLEHGACFFVMELCDESFQSFLLHGISDDLNERSYSRIFSELLLGLRHVHSKNVVHRDIKPDNVMVSNSVAKLCDFGLAGVLAQSVVAGGSGGLSGIYGTAPFMAPEMLNREVYKTEVDVWSIGVIAYVFFNADFPYVPEQKNSAEMKRIIREGKKLPSFRPRARSSEKQLPSVSKDAETFLRALLNRSKGTRIDAAEALKLQFLQAPSTEQTLPSLKLTLKACLKCGAFENRQVDKFDQNLDPLLEQLHRRHTGTSLAQADARPPTKAKAKHARSDASTEDTCNRSRTPSVVSGASSVITVNSNATPDWKTTNMSAGGRHEASHSKVQS